MHVHFYEIRGCTCENVNNKPVLVAPPDTRLDLLTRYQFLLLDDGRWVHFLNNTEYAHVMTGYPYQDVSFFSAQQPLQPVSESPEDRQTGNLLAGIGLGLLGLYLLLNIGEWGMLKTLSTPNQIQEGSSAASVLNLLFTALPLASFVLMLITRIKYPKNVMGKVLMWLFIVGGVLLILFMIAILVACVSCMHECSNSTGC